MGQSETDASWFAPIADVLAEINKTEEWLRILKERLITLPGQIAASMPDEADRIRVARYLYWNVQAIKPATIAEAFFGATACQLARILGPGEESGITCSECGSSLKLKSRQDAKDKARFPADKTALCETCKAADAAEKQERWKQEAAADRERKRQLRTMPYADYLKTPEWQSQRFCALHRAKHKCNVCNAMNKVLNVHHRTYIRRGQEHTDDLIVLCEDCHDLFHKQGKLAS